MKYELLLHWASEQGRGGWPEFREAHDWLFNSGNQGDRQVRATTTIQAFSMLGHLEIDWETGIWAVAPPALTILPNAGAHAILAGARNRVFVHAFNDATSSAEYFSVMHRQEWGPDAIFLAASSERAVEGLAAELQIGYEVCVSERLAVMLPSLASYLTLCESTPGAHGYGVERFDSRYLTFRRVASDAEPGFYRYDVWGRPEFRFVSEDGRYYKLDHALGVYAELARAERSEIYFERDTVNGTLVVPFRAQLPALHARAAALCSGLMPKLVEWKWRYPNVPRETANAIAASLCQTLMEPLRAGGGDA